VGKAHERLGPGDCDRTAGTPCSDALAGNIGINNCFNARAFHAAVAAKVGTVRVPAPD
jgi:hypothetical protein